MILAQVVAMGGERDEALRVLDRAEAAFKKLGDLQGVAQARELREMIVGAGSTGTDPAP
jgi:hypothetical protein